MLATLILGCPFCNRSIGVCKEFTLHVKPECKQFKTMVADSYMLAVNRELKARVSEEYG